MSSTAAARHSLEYAPSMSSIAASTSSPSTGGGSPRLDSVLTLSTATTSSTSQRRAPRRSLSLLGKLPKDISSLLRSHSSSSRRTSTVFQTDPPARVLLADYEHPYDHTITAKDMYARREDDRLARKQRPENRFYSFLTRSRSRSRSKTDPSLDHESTIPELVHDYPHNTTHSRQSSGSVREDKSSKPSTYRPLSTTTTATNTTIMPPTPKPRRTPAPYPEVPPHNNENTSRPSTPSRGPSNTRKKLHNIFGIPLTGPRRSGSRKSSISSTRPSTPDLHSAPPLPDPGSSHDSTPSRRNNAPPPLDFHRSSSPSLRSRSKQSTFDSVESSTSTSAPRDHQFKSQKLFLARVPTASSQSEDRQTSLVVSGPTKHKRSHTGHSESLPSTPLTPSTPIHRNIQAPQPRHAADGNTVISAVPRITHTPATPQRPETTPPRLSQRKNSLDSSRRQMSVVDEERSLMDIDADKSRRRESSRQGHHSVITKMRSSNVRSTRHGSFDFERPGWGTTGITRSMSGNSTSTTATIPKGTGSGENLHIGESLKGKMREIPGSDILRRKGSQRTAPSPIPPLEPDHTGASTSTTHSRSTNATNGLTSSLGRNSGKRTLGSGVAKLVGIPHGPFSFEPPVPSPTISTSTHGSAFSDYEKEAEEREKVERRRKRREVKREELALRESRRNDMPDFNPLPPTSSVGFRSAAKGRSLDLGLGLSWAPTKVRQNALIPSNRFPLDGRSLSASSRSGMRRNFMEVDDDEEDEELAQLGKGIAEKFRSALDADGYHLFKKYVHRFDAQEIPIDGPDGIITRARRLLDRSRNLTETQKNALSDDLFKVILRSA